MDRLIVLAPPCQTRVHNALVIPISRETLSAMFRPRNPQRKLRRRGCNGFCVNGVEATDLLLGRVEGDEEIVVECRLGIERNASNGRNRQIRMLQLPVVAFSSDRRRRAGLGTGGRVLPAFSAIPAREWRRRLADHIRQ